MKYVVVIFKPGALKVSALAAEWIEIGRRRCWPDGSAVSALAAEWIEICRRLPDNSWSPESPPSRRSGLK